MKKEVYSLSFSFDDFILIIKSYGSPNKVFSDWTKRVQPKRLQLFDVMSEPNLLVYKTLSEEKYCIYNLVKDKVLF